MKWQVKQGSKKKNQKTEGDIYHFDLGMVLLV